MRNTKRSIMGFAAVAAGCASLMAATPVFATEQVEPIKAVLISQDAEAVNTTDAIMLTVMTTSYDELANEGIVSAETVQKMNEFAEKNAVQITVDQDQMKEIPADEQGDYLATLTGSYSIGGLDEMVTEGIITQAEKDKIDEYYASQVTEGTAAVMMEAAIAVDTATAE